MYNIVSFKYIHTRRSAFMYLLMAIYERDKRKERERDGLIRLALRRFMSQLS